MLLENWKMAYEEHTDIHCTVPCSMYSVLYENKIIPNPYYGLNEYNLVGLSDKGCTFETEFDVDDETMQMDYQELIFHGLDTICDIYLNGTLLKKVKNAHRIYRIDVKDYLKPRKNTLRCDFESPTQFMTQMHNKKPTYLNGETISGAGFLRKPLYMSGWDWGPSLPDMGIFRPVELNCYNVDKIDNIFVIQKHNEDFVTLDVEVSTYHNSDAEIYVNIDGKDVKLTDGKATVTIENPKLWWVRGYGEQYLYDISAYLEKDGKILDKKKQKLGLRTLTVSCDKDEIGNEFCFVINGIKIFAMGADCIPEDSLLSRITEQTTRRLIDNALDANFNCIRIWGGGYYPNDYFYDLCDKEGIIVWQDFMVACANIFLGDGMKEELVEEAKCNLKRLRHHASLGLLCGNNEMEIAVKEWPEVVTSDDVITDYLELYENILPEICKEYAPQTFYWSSSPSSGGGFDDPGSPDRGDVHFWEVWHDSKPYTEYRKHKFRFCSEYGFESYPNMKTIQSFCEEEDMNCFSRVMESHQKCKNGNQKILMYLSERYRYPNNFADLVYASQLLQGDAIKYGVEHFRRNRGVCMGSLYWQFNDCWPVASWSSVDYFGRCKALHWYAKKFYAPVALALFVENEVLSVNIANETVESFKGEIRISRCTNTFEVKEKYDCSVCVGGLTSEDVYTMKLQSDDKYSEYIFADLYDDKGNFMMRQTELFCKPKNFLWQRPLFSADIIEVENGVRITVSSDVFAKGVCVDFDGLDCHLSDNFFDLTSKDAYIITAKTTYSPNELMEKITFKSVYDVGR